MKRQALWFGILATVLLGSLPSSAAPSLVGRRVLWLGDSITADGKYVTDVEYYLEKQSPDARVDIVCIGLSSETVSGLSEKKHPFPRPCVLERLGRALELVKPQVVVACYGMNDGIYHPPGADRLKAFQEGVGKLIAAVKGAGAELILLTPPPFDPVPVRSRLRSEGASDFSFMNPYEKYDDTLAEFARWELTLPATNAFVIDLHSPMVEEINRRRVAKPDFTFSGDGIHPSPPGHLLMAVTILKALGVPVGGKDLDAEVTTFFNNPIYTLVTRHRETRSKGWVAYVGYTRGETVKTDSVEETELAARALQRQVDGLRAK